MPTRLPDDIAKNLGLGSVVREAFKASSAIEQFRKFIEPRYMVDEAMKQANALQRAAAWAQEQPFEREALREAADLMRSPELEHAADAYRRHEEETRRLIAAPALINQDLAQGLAEVEHRRLLAPAMAAIEAVHPDWDRLLGTASIRKMLDGWQDTKTALDALLGLDTTHEDLVARIGGSTVWIQLQNQMRSWDQATAPTWSDAMRMVDSLDWADLVEEVTAGDTASVGTPTVQLASQPVGASAKRRRRPISKVDLALYAALLTLVFQTLQFFFGDNIAPRLEAHFRELPPSTEEVRRSPSTTRTWATVAIRTTLHTDADAASAVLVELQPGTWIRVIEEQQGWLLVEAETGRASKITGWISTAGTKRLDEALLEHTIQQLQAALPTEPTGHPVTPAEVPSSLPAVIVDAGSSASQRYAEFFAASIRNRNTRAAYWQACSQFLGRCEEAGLTLDAIQPVHVAGYVEHLSQSAAAPTVKQHLAAIRRMFDFLVVGQILPANPAASVRGPKHVVSEGKTPILDAEEVRTLFAQFDDTRLIDLRDRAILGAMVYSFARVGALAKLRVKDYYRQGARAWFVLDEKGGKQNRVPAHHQVAEYIEQYLTQAGIEAQRETPLFRSLGRGRGGRGVTERGLRREEIFAMVRRRTAAVGLPPEIGCHSFRGTGITNYLKNGGTIETAAKLAGHASTRTTQLYDRRSAEVAQTEIERIRF
jgi:site-specific recombinase XerD